MKRLFKNAKTVCGGGVSENSFCLVEDGIITYVGKNAVEYDIATDCGGEYLIPGFIDIHCHGGDGFDFMDASPQEMKKISEYHLKHGTTSLLATTMTDDISHIEKALDNYGRHIRKYEDTTLVGVHLEGPWLSPVQSGAQSGSSMTEPDPLLLKRWLKKYPFIKRVSIAPELKNGYETGRICMQNGVVASVAHTDADFGTVQIALNNGYSLMTHLYSGMNGVTRKNAYRTAGAVEAGLYFDDLNVEIIADGKHLPSELLKYIYKIKGAGRICLITDAMRGSGLEEGSRTVLGRKDGGLPVIIEDGVAKVADRSSFAGSTATADRIFKTMAEATNADIVHLSEMASLTPAKVMGLSDRGEIAAGKRADLLLMDKNYNIKQVFLKGEKI